jgi:transmembrane sensor
MSPSAFMKAQQEAVGWMMRQQDGLSAAEEAEFTAWVSESQDHKDAWAQAEATWREIDAEDDPVLEAMRADALTARPDRAGRLLPWAAAAAAVVLIVSVVGGLTWQAHSPAWAPNGQEIALTAAPTYSTTGSQQTVLLADGSQATLDQDTALAVRFADGRRDLRLLRGRALFDVRHETRPFAVAAADTMITATGTRFSVGIAAGSVSATLERGSVTVTREHDPALIILSPGQMATSTPGRPMQVSHADPVRSLPESPEYLEFQDTPLADAVDAMNRQGTIRIRVVGAAAHLKLNGRFRADDPLGFVAAVTAELPVRQRTSPDGAIELSLRSKR